MREAKIHGQDGQEDRENRIEQQYQYMHHSLMLLLVMQFHMLFYDSISLSFLQTSKKPESPEEQKQDFSNSPSTTS